MNLLRRLIKWLFANDPVYSCEVYNGKGCAHVDGMICNMESCTILKKHRKYQASRPGNSKIWGN